MYVLAKLSCKYSVIVHRADTLLEHRVYFMKASEDHLPNGEAHECYRIFQTWTSCVCTRLGYLGLKLKPVVLWHAGSARQCWERGDADRKGTGLWYQCLKLFHLQTRYKVGQVVVYARDVNCSEGDVVTQTREY